MGWYAADPGASAVPWAATFLDAESETPRADYLFPLSTVLLITATIKIRPAVA
jgi:hypothetical protein